MEAAVDAMTIAFDSLMESVAAVLREPARLELLVVFKDSLEVFTATCDYAQGVVQNLAARITVSGEFDVMPPSSVSAKLDALLLSVHTVVQDVHARASMAHPFQQEGTADGNKAKDYGLPPSVPLAIDVPEAVEDEEVTEDKEINQEVNLHALTHVVAVAEHNVQDEEKEAAAKEKEPAAEKK
ncbi:hypothetical protein ACP4OV_001173 [Aristida adscensionis]